MHHAVSTQYISSDKTDSIIRPLLTQRQPGKPARIDVVRYQGHEQKASVQASIRIAVGSDVRFEDIVIDKISPFDNMRIHQ